MDIIRLQVSQRKELSEICEFICDHCLAPDTSSGAGVGCDNMTIMIVGLLNGRTKEEWYDWMAERVEKHIGYETPSEIPQIYAPSRISAFQARRQASEGRENRNAFRENNGFGGAGALNLARTLLGGGIPFHPSTGILAEDGTLMFGGDDSDEEEDINEGEDDDGDYDMNRPLPSHAAFLAALGVRPPPPRSDVTRDLRARLDEFEDIDADGAHISDGEEGEHVHEFVNHKESDDEDQLIGDHDDEAQQAFGASVMRDSSGPAKPPPLTIGRAPNGSASQPQEEEKTETPPPPVIFPNGNAIKQLSTPPGGDEISPIVKVEGFLDSSEDPLKG